jgi:hypothetical protein
MAPVSLAPRFNGVFSAAQERNRFNGFPSRSRAIPSSSPLDKKTVETVGVLAASRIIPLKRGANEIA